MAAAAAAIHKRWWIEGRVRVPEACGARLASTGHSLDKWR
jgi:hypothetical protein